jgi:hypothetical protein
MQHVRCAGLSRWLKPIAHPLLPQYLFAAIEYGGFSKKYQTALTARGLVWAGARKCRNQGAERSHPRISAATSRASGTFDSEGFFRSAESLQFRLGAQESVRAGHLRRLAALVEEPTDVRDFRLHVTEARKESLPSILGADEPAVPFSRKSRRFCQNGRRVSRNPSHNLEIIIFIRNYIVSVLAML